MGKLEADSLVGGRSIAAHWCVVAERIANSCKIAAERIEGSCKIAADSIDSSAVELAVGFVADSSCFQH